jgi:acetyltransferase-like isoleucine patch superfamily enzyme
MWIKPQPKHLEMTEWGWLVSYPENLDIGIYVDIGAFSYIQAKFGVKIGARVQIGSHCSIYSHDTIGKHEGPVILEDECCIGSHSTLLPNVTIGKGLIIPAYSFVKFSILNQQDLDAFLKNKRQYNFKGML